MSVTATKRHYQYGIRRLGIPNDGPFRIGRIGFGLRRTDPVTGPGKGATVRTLSFCQVVGYDEKCTSEFIQGQHQAVVLYFPR